jgi:hypothetical protein
MFAIFSTQPGDHLERYALFKFNDNGVENVPITSDIHLLYNEDESGFENITIRGNVRYHYWHTGWDIIKDGIIIPIYDFINKGALFQEVTLVSSRYDNIDWCNYRIRDQKIMYSCISRKYQVTEEVQHIRPTINVTTPVNSPTVASPKVSINNEKLPTFVAEALIKSAKDSNAECSISMTPFKECPKISVTNCYHCFETDSLEEWRQRKSTCPMCKCEIKFITTI